MRGNNPLPLSRGKLRYWSAVLGSSVVDENVDWTVAFGSLNERGDRARLEKIANDVGCICRQIPYPGGGFCQSLLIASNQDD